MIKNQNIKKNLFSLILFFSVLILTSIWIYNSRNYSDSSTAEMKKKLFGMIENLRSHSYQLSNLINDTQYNISKDIIDQFYPRELDKSSSELVVKLNKDSDNVYITKRKKIKDSLELIRYSISNYKLALNVISTQKFMEAKNYLRKVNYYLDKAEKEILIKTAENSLIQKPL